MITSEIFDIIFKNANVDILPYEEPYAEIKKQLRYYREDIPRSPRYLYDADAVYFYNVDKCICESSEEKKHRESAERGDIMTSIWAPMTYYLGLNHCRIIEKNNKSIDMIIENEKTNDAFFLIDYLSKQYVSRGNLLLLPNSVNTKGKKCLNPDKFKKSEDKLDQFLYACLSMEFEKLTLIEYFDNNIENVKKWIFSERLECMFSSTLFQYSLSEIEKGEVSVEIKWEDVCKDNLQSLINDTSRIGTYKYKDFRDEDWLEYFDRLNKVIAYRNSVDIQSHFPFEWIET